MNIQQITEQINTKLLEQLAKGTPPWQKGWHVLNNQNLITKHTYTGINRLYTSVIADERKYKSNYWLTYTNIEQAGGKLVNGKGQGVPIVHFGNDYKLNGKWLSYKTYKQLDEATKRQVKISGHLAFFYVFNFDLVEGIEAPKVEVKKEPVNNQAEQIVNGYTDKPTIQFGGNRAFYSPTSDYIQMPPLKQFKSMSEYYATLYHELAHSTGHESRLNRTELKTMTHFGSSVYSQEELVAEITASYLLGTAGIDTITNNSAYIKGWSKALQTNKNWFIEASSKAEKAYKFILKTQ